MKSIQTRISKRLIRAFFLLAVAPFCTQRLLADDLSVPKQFVNATTIAVAKIDPKRLSVPDSLSKNLSEVSSLQPTAKSILRVVQELIAASNGESVFVTVDVPFSSGQPPVRIFVRNAPGVNAAKLFEHLERLQFNKPVVQGNHLCFSMVRTTQSSGELVVSDSTIPSERPDVEIAMQAVKEYPIQFLILPPGYIVATFQDLMPSVPSQYGGGPMTVLTEGVKWSAIGVDPAKVELKAITQSKTAEAAKTLASRLPGLLSASASRLRILQATTSIEKLQSWMKPMVEGDRMTISINGLSELDQTVAWITAAMAQVLGPMTTQVKMDRFKQIGLAIHNFESANRVLPPPKEGRNAEGKSNLSWRVHILPYMEQLELYSQFHLKEAWDSEHNAKLLEKMPDVYKGGILGVDKDGQIKPGYTTFLAPVGEGTIFGGPKPVRFSDMTDGSSNTIWLVEVKAEFAKPWTAPEDYPFEIANPAKGLAEIPTERPSFLGAVADGSVSTFFMDLPAETILHLFQMNDGHAVSWP